MSDLQSAFDKLLNEQRELQRKFQATAQALFKETTKEFFEKNPAITAIVWTQYTPYFNDGDTCEFSVHEPNFTNAKNLDDISRWGEYEGDDDNEWSESPWGFKYHKRTDAEGINIDSINKFAELIQSSELESVMEAMFGDHVRVLATREGFDVEDIDHD